MEAQIFEAVNLIVDIGTSHKRAALGIFVTTIEQCYWVWHVCNTIVGIRPGCVAIVVGAYRPLEITTEVLQRLLKVITQQLFVIGRCEVVWILCGIIVNSSTDSSTVSILCLGVHTLSVEVQCEVILKERRVQVDGCRNTLEVGGLEDTLLVGITYRETIRQILESA